VPVGGPHTPEERHHRLGLAQRRPASRTNRACQRAAAA
jgi:hypothetical protein